VFYPKVIYENLPYLCFLICAYLVAFYDTWMVYTSAGLFYIVACIMLVQRSNYRRVDRYKDNEKYRQTLPPIIYEYMPYAYFAIAMILLLKTQFPALQFLAFCLMIIALKNMLFRINNRRKAKSLF
tara:strand:- start:191 stop:568 length:378 start_codon:yes stop_codon:yes gene_type:complete